MMERAVLGLEAVVCGARLKARRPPRVRARTATETHYPAAELGETQSERWRPAPAPRPEVRIHSSYDQVARISGSQDFREQQRRRRGNG